MTDEQVQDFVKELWNRIDRTKEGTKKYEWVCGNKGNRLYYSKQLAHEKGIGLADIIVGYTVHCDCEVVFNIGEEDE